MKNNQFVRQKTTYRRLGGHPLLDFCNTYIEHSNRVEDKIASARSAEQCLRDLFSIKTKLSRPALSQLLRLRQTVRRYFEIHLQKRSNKVHLEQLNKELSRHKFELAVRPDFSVALTCEKKAPLFNQVILEQLYRFNLNSDLAKTKKCQNPHCSHLFYDDSKNQSRRWCSMQSCGNIMKARRFYNKQRKKS